MTNKEWLTTLSAEEFFDEFKKAEQEMRFEINTRLAMIEWLDQEHTD
jgi:hypothetical protein